MTASRALTGTGKGSALSCKQHVRAASDADAPPARNLKRLETKDSEAVNLDTTAPAELGTGSRKGAPQLRRSGAELELHFRDVGGAPCRLVLTMPSTYAADKWVKCFEALRGEVPSLLRGAPYWHWTLSCMEATSRRGGRGVVRKSTLRPLLNRTNGGAAVSVEQFRRIAQDATHTTYYSLLAIITLPSTYYWLLTTYHLLFATWRNLKLPAQLPTRY